MDLLLFNTTLKMQFLLICGNNHFSFSYYQNHASVYIRVIRGQRLFRVDSLISKYFRKPFNIKEINSAIREEFILDKDESPI